MSLEIAHPTTQTTKTEPKKTQHSEFTQSDPVDQLENSPTIENMEKEKGKHHGGLRQLETSAEMGESQQSQENHNRQKQQISSEPRQLPIQHHVNVGDKQLQIGISLGCDYVEKGENVLEPKAHHKEDESIQKNVPYNQYQQSEPNIEQKAQIRQYNNQHSQEQKKENASQDLQTHLKNEIIPQKQEKLQNSVDIKETKSIGQMPIIHEKRQSKIKTLSYDQAPQEKIKIKQINPSKVLNKVEKTRLQSQINNGEKGLLTEPLLQITNKQRIPKTCSIALNFNSVRERPVKKQKCPSEVSKWCNCEIM